MNNYNNFLNEKFGSNELVIKIKNNIISQINDNFGILSLMKKILLFDELNDIVDKNGYKYIFKNSIINVKISNRYYGNINQNIKISNNKNVFTIENLEINLELILSDTEQKMKKLDNNKIEASISHELLHLIELIYSENNKALSWSKNIELRKMQKKYENNKHWTNISHIIYLTLPHELRAKIQELDTYLKNDKPSDILNYLKNSEIYKEFEMISLLDVNMILSKLKTDQDYLIIIEDFTKLFLNKNDEKYEKNMRSYLNYLKKSSKKILDKIIRLSYSNEDFLIDDVDWYFKIDFNEYLK